MSTYDMTANPINIDDDFFSSISDAPSKPNDIMDDLNSMFDGIFDTSNKTDNNVEEVKEIQEANEVQEEVSTDNTENETVVESVAEDTVNNSTVEEVKEQQETVSETVVEEAPVVKKRKRRTKEQIAADNAAKEAESKANTEENKIVENIVSETNNDTDKYESTKSNANVIYMPINTDTIDVVSVVSNLSVMPKIQNFDEFKDEVQDKMKYIVIDKNLDPANINLINERIDELTNILYNQYSFMKSSYDNIANKETGLLSVVRHLNETGENTTVRTRNGIMAAMNYELPDGTKCNLFQIVWATKRYFDFIDQALIQLETKRRLVKSQSDAMAMRK